MRVCISNFHAFTEMKKFNELICLGIFPIKVNEFATFFFLRSTNRKNFKFNIWISIYSSLIGWNRVTFSNQWKKNYISWKSFIIWSSLFIILFYFFFSSSLSFSPLPTPSPLFRAYQLAISRNKNINVSRDKNPYAYKTRETFDYV